MFILANYYAAYSERKMFAQLYGKSTSWDNAEQMAMFSSFITGNEVSPTEFLTSNEEKEDEIYSRTKIINRLKETIEVLEIDEDDIIAFCESAIHEHIPILNVNYINFAEQMKHIVLYSIGAIDKLDLFDISIVPPNIRPFKSIMFKRTWYGIENRYNEIWMKRHERRFTKFINQQLNEKR